MECLGTAEFAAVVGEDGLDRDFVLLEDCMVGSAEPHRQAEHALPGG